MNINRHGRRALAAGLRRNTAATSTKCTDIPQSETQAFYIRLAATAKVNTSDIF